MLTIVVLLLVSLTVKAQDCKAYMPIEAGTTMQLTHYDKKGKITGVSSQELVAVDKKGSNTTFVVNQKFEDAKEKQVVETELSYRCEDGVFYIDMDGYLDSEQMKAYQDMDIKVTVDEMDIPASFKVGQQLKDGAINMEVTGAPMPFKMTVNVVNRKVEAEEDLSTPAGTFSCIKISQDIITKSVVKVTVSSVEWYAEGVGLIRSETFRKGKLMGYSELTALQKPE